jgi:hypothetical protein
VNNARPLAIGKVSVLAITESPLALVTIPFRLPLARESCLANFTAEKVALIETSGKQRPTTASAYYDSRVQPFVDPQFFQQ